MLFWHKLAPHLHFHSVEEMLARLDARQLLRWRAAYMLDPWGGERQDLNAATVASMWAGKGTKMADLMPDFMKAYRAQRGQDEGERRLAKARAMKMELMIYTAKVGGTVR